MTALTFLLLVVVNICGYILGYIFTETERFDLAQFKIFNVKPFNCQKCLTFHILWVSQVFIALLLNSLIYGGLGIVFAAITYLGIKLNEK